ncbi:hypothetical protein FOL47_011254 [Perkinsus chesapeaki]|uniref:Uncharacterized protein n=1 Tax=Perkinsus chesapeaki TaxID=330153 RepID=A0A7J6MMU5_PERCH|nr:hypothetical protein FOL47_011254 [Perkinsus chesapeaki]
MSFKLADMSQRDSHCSIQKASPDLAIAGWVPKPQHHQHDDPCSTVDQSGADTSAWPHGMFKRALIIGIDGLGGVYLRNITKDHAPTLKSLIDSDECAYTFSARNKNPTISAPNWSTILTGIPPAGTGILSNGWSLNDSSPSSLVDGRVAPVTGAGKLPPTIFHSAKTFSKLISTASAYGWSWLQTLSGNDVDHEFDGKMHDDGPVKFLFDLMIADDAPHVTFLHIEEVRNHSLLSSGRLMPQVDSAGHESYWGSPQYYAALKNADGYVFKMLEALGQGRIEDETLILITADHGGYRNNHGAWDTANTDTPAIFCSTAKLIKNPGHMERWVDNMDYVPTILSALGIPLEPFHRGTNHKWLFETSDYVIEYS